MISLIAAWYKSHDNFRFFFQTAKKSTVVRLPKWHMRALSISPWKKFFSEKKGVARGVQNRREITKKNTENRQNDLGIQQFSKHISRII